MEGQRDRGKKGERALRRGIRRCSAPGSRSKPGAPKRPELLGTMWVPSPRAQGFRVASGRHRGLPAAFPPHTEPPLALLGEGSVQGEAPHLQRDQVRGPGGGRAAQRAGRSLRWHNPLVETPQAQEECSLERRVGRGHVYIDSGHHSILSYVSLPVCPLWLWTFPLAVCFEASHALCPSPAGPAQAVLGSRLLTPKVTKAMGCWGGSHAPWASVSSRQREGSTGWPLRPLAPQPHPPAAKPASATLAGAAASAPG